MKKTIPGTIAATLAVGGLLLVPTAASAADVDAFGICTPSEASTETIVHPAIGEPTLIVENPDYIPAVDTIPAQPAIGEPTIEIANPDYVAPTYTPGWTEHVPAAYTPAVGTPTIEVERENPDYVPAVPERTEVIHHEAETKVVHHEAVTKYHEEVSHTEYQWKWWGYAQHGKTTWTDGTYPDHKPNSAPGEWRKNGNTKKVVDQEAWTETIKEAWDETVVVKDAWDETVTIPGTPAVGEPTIWVTIDNPDYVAPTYVPAHDIEHAPVYTPAVGTPKITVENPDYVAATEEIPGTPAVGEPTLVVDNPEYVAERSEVIEHEAVVCPTDKPEAPKPQARGAAAAADDTETLAQTGGGSDALWAIAGLGMIAAGGAAVAIRRKRA